MFSACETYEKQLRIEKTRLSHQVWSHGGSTFKKKRTLNGHFSRPAETDPYVAYASVIPGGLVFPGFAFVFVFGFLCGFVFVFVIVVVHICGICICQTRWSCFPRVSR